VSKQPLNAVARWRFLRRSRERLKTERTDRAVRQTLLLLLGWGIVIVGAFTVLDALLWGLLLLALGLYLLSFEQPWVRDRRAGLERRFPEAAGWLAKAEETARGLYEKATGRPPDDDRDGGRDGDRDGGADRRTGRPGRSSSRR